MSLFNYKRRNKKRAKLVSNKNNIVVEKLSNISLEETLKFYNSIEWKELRKEYLNDNKRKYFECNYCEENVSKNRSLNIDHIRPIKTHWHLRLDKNNLQILCQDCNKFKGSKQDIKSLKEECILNKYSIVCEDDEEDMSSWSVNSLTIIEKIIAKRKQDKEEEDDDFQFNQNFEIEEGTRSPGWIRYQKKINYDCSCDNCKLEKLEKEKKEKKHFIKRGSALFERNKMLKKIQNG